jgi:hypothetical protein
MKISRPVVPEQSCESSMSKRLAAGADNPLVLAQSLLAAGEADRALSTLKTASSTDAVTNACGVCLMRMGRAAPALDLFRHLAVSPGCTWMRAETPVIYRSNYCTALILTGHPDGAVELLHSMVEQSHPSVARLQQAVTAWASRLSVLQRLQWKLGLVPETPVPLDFPPGDIFDPVASPQTVGSPPSNVPLKQAV